MNDFRIEPLTLEQIIAVAALFEMQMAEHHVERSHAELVAGLKTVLTHTSQGFVLIALSGSKPIGVAYGACILSLEHGGWSGWLDELYVLPEWRGRGVGSALLAAVVAEAKGRAWAALDLEVDLDHQRVVPLYQRNRFEPVERNRFVRRLRGERGSDA